jgi:hypothetical protein
MAHEQPASKADQKAKVYRVAQQAARFAILNRSS